MKLSIRDIQRLLAAAGYYTGGIDGDYGRNTHAAVNSVLTKYRSSIPRGRISSKRRTVMAAQILLKEFGHQPGSIDGYLGNNTFEAFNAWDYVSANKKPEIFRTDVSSTSNSIWPSYAQAESFYGPTGTNQVRFQFPYPMKIAWNTRQTVNSSLCHKKVAKPMVEIFQRTLDTYGYDGIKTLGLDKFGGILNVRKMRGGSRWSTHSWGVACDLDPINNQLRWGSGRATFSRPEYDKFWEIVESTGAVSLGRVKNYDWMHFQFISV